MSTDLARPQQTPHPYGSSPLPPVGSADHPRIIQWTNESVDYTNVLRAEDLRRWRLAELYDQSKQNLMRWVGMNDRAGIATHFVEAVLEDGEIPMPVLNEGIGPRRNESSRLGRPNYRPTVRPKGRDPAISLRDAATNRKRYLHHRLYKMGWPTEEDLLAYQDPLYGGVFVDSRWVQRLDQLGAVPIKGAQKCPQCVDPNDKARPGFIAAAARLNRRDPKTLPAIQKLGPSAMNALHDDGASIGFNGCPKCGAPLMPYNPTLEEAEGGTDSLGFALGEWLPLGEWEMRVRSPFDIFLPNHGINMRANDLFDVTIVHVEHLDWFARHYPQTAKGIEPENPATLAAMHPLSATAGARYADLGGHSFRNSARAIERHRAPWPEWNDEQQAYVMNQGRSTCVSGNKLLYDGALLMRSPVNQKETVERFKMNYIRWELLDGGRRVHGLSMWDLFFDAQDAVNECAGQESAIRQRLAVPLIVIGKETNLETRELKAGVPGQFLVVGTSANQQALKPEIINNVTAPPGIPAERRSHVDFINRAGGHTATEQGQSDPAIDTAAQSKILKESSGETREDRIERIREALQPLFQHGDDLHALMILESREVSYEDPESGEEGEISDTFTPEQLATGVRMVVGMEPDVPDEDEQRLKVRDWLGSGAVDPTTIAANRRLGRKLGRLLGAPDELYEGEDMQERSALREFAAFKNGQNPAVDPTADDHEAHFEQHGLDMAKPWFRDLMKRGEWDKALKVLEPDWFMTVNIAALTPGQGSTQDRIYASWQTILMQASMPTPAGVDARTGLPTPEVPPIYAPPKDEAGLDALDAVLRWRAHCEAHRLHHEWKQQRALAMPTLAAPGDAAKTAAGNEVTAADPAAAASATPAPGPPVAVSGSPGVPGVVRA